MNIQRYSSIYAAFHKCKFPDVHQNLMIVSFNDIPCTRNYLLRLVSFSHVYSSSNRPLLDAFKIFYKSDTLCTVFEDQFKQTILMGNERMLTPVSERGKCMLCATQLFVKDTTIFEDYLKGQGRMIYKNVYTFRNSIIYLDQYDIPCPGKTYFEDAEPNNLYRICFVTHNVNDIDVSEWQNRKEIYYIPFKTKRVTTLPKFINYHPIEEPQIPDMHAISTGTIQKKLCYRNSYYLLQDVLNSYQGSLDSLGVIIEYPFCMGFDGTCQSTQRYVALAVNGNFPKKTIQVKMPYERYIEYDYVPTTQWFQIYYDKHPSTQLDRISIDATIIGYGYRNVFFCLSHPLLNNAGYYPMTYTESICNICDNLDLLKDSNIEVLDTYCYDDHHTLHRVKLKVITQDLWFLAKNSKANSFPKRHRPPHLVNHWLDFYSRNCHKSELNFNDLHVVKLAYHLAKHKICFKIKMTNRNRKVELEKDGLLFRIDEEAALFLNDVRLKLDDDKIDSNREDPMCSVM